MPGKLTGKVAIVTGSATGIGRAVAQLYAAEGARVVVADVREDEGENTAEAIRRSGRECVFVRTDVALSEDLENVVAFAESKFGRLDIMTANAGIGGPKGPIEDIREPAISQVMSVNFNGVLFAFQHAIPALRRSGGGALTATASVAALRGWSQLGLYSASKGAVEALVRSLAIELAPEIRVNAVAPGSVATDFRPGSTSGDRGSGDPQAEPSSTEATYAILPQASPDDVASVHLFLASADSALISGQVIVVDGGRINYGGGLGIVI